MTLTRLSPFRPAKINLLPPTPQSSDIRSIPELLEYNAVHNPDHPFCLQAKKKTKEHAYEFSSLTHLELKKAVLRCSEWLLSNIAQLELPRKNENGEIIKGKAVALFMESDVGLVIQLLSLLSLGVPVMLLSARLSPTAIHHLLEETSAAVIIASPRLSNVAEEALSIFPDGAINVPKLQTQPAYEIFFAPEIGGTKETQSIDFSNHYVDDHDRNVLILHSSGTTGLPKALYSSHRFLLTFTAAHEFKNEEEAGGMVVSTLPLFHGYGLVTPLLGMGVGKPFCLPASSIVPNGNSTVELLEATQARALMTVPSILEDIALLEDQKGIKALLKLEFIAFGGGPLKESVGDLLDKSGVKLLNHYGATEVGPLAPIFVPGPRDSWRYFKLRKDMGLEIIPVESTDEVQPYKLLTHPFGWKTSFELQDHLITDPNNAGTHFTTLGRKDDLIVLATGEKVVPRFLETSLTDSTLIKEAVAFGENQFELGIIIEPTTGVSSTEEVGAFRAMVWPLIEKANEVMDNHARISSPAAIIIAQPDQPIPRSDKGSVMRKETYRVFASEIEKVYEDLENDVAGDVVLDLRSGFLEQGIMDVIKFNLNWKSGVEELAFDQDFFELGMDSLQATRLRRLLIGFIRASEHPELVKRVTREFIYQHPSISYIAEELRRSDDSLVDGHTENFDEIEVYENLYSLKPSHFSTASVVLLTGSTGSLGTYLLASLASSKEVSKIICLNRPRINSASKSDTRLRQVEACKTKGVSLSAEAWAKVENIEANAASENLGLSGEEYNRLQGQVTHVLHSSWPVDFKRKLASFKSQFETVQNLLGFARDCHTSKPGRKSRFLFVSSIAVVGQYYTVYGSPMVPEVPMPDSKCTNDFGYGKAKLVCERIIERAGEDFADEIEVTSVRLGQIAGSTSSGYWNSDEHIPALIKSSQKIGALPLIKGTLSWCSVNCIASILSDILFSTQKYEKVYHIENPNRQSWYDALVVLNSELGLSSTFLSLEEWVKRVKDIDSKLDEENPARKLAGFFSEDFPRMAGGKVVLRTDKTAGVSPTLRGLDVTSDDLIKQYVKAWREVGFLR